MNICKVGVKFLMCMRTSYKGERITVQMNRGVEPPADQRPVPQKMPLTDQFCGVWSAGTNSPVSGSTTAKAWRRSPLRSRFEECEARRRMAVSDIASSDLLPAEAEAGVDEEAKLAADGGGGGLLEPLNPWRFSQRSFCTSRGALLALTACLA